MGIRNLFQSQPIQPSITDERDAFAPIQHANQLGLRFETPTLPHPTSAMPLFDAPSSPEFLGVMPKLDTGNNKPRSKPSIKHILKLQDITIQYALKRSSRRTIGFSIGVKGLIVSAPHRASMNMIEAALLSKQKWLVTKLRLVQTKAKEALEKPLQRWEHGATLPYLGKTIALDLCSGTSLTRLQHGMFNKETLLLSLNESASSQDVQTHVHQWLQAEAKKLFAQRIPVYESLLNVKINRWRLSNAKARWGSASSDKVISLHWRLIQFSPEIIDYVIAHELAHLHEMNHSPRFWAWVETACPNYRQLRKVLKQEAIDV